MPTQNRRQSGPPTTRSRPEPRSNLDPGAYIGRKPERIAETIPGGVGPADRRVSAVATQPDGRQSNGSQGERDTEAARAETVAAERGTDDGRRIETR